MAQHIVFLSALALTYAPLCASQDSRQLCVDHSGLVAGPAYGEVSAVGQAVPGQDSKEAIRCRARGLLDPSVTKEEKKSLYNAAMSGTPEDVAYVLDGLKELEFNVMKQALHACEIPGEKVQIYVHMFEDVYLDQAYEPFVDTLKKFPELTQKAVGSWLYQVLEYKMSRVESAIREPWLVQELQLLQKYKS